MPTPFITGHTVSSDTPVEITAGTDPSSFTTSETGPRNRTWRLTAAASGANLPDNPYRASVVVNNIAGGATAYLVATDTVNPAYTAGWTGVSAGVSTVFSRQNLLTGTGPLAVVLDGASGGECVVTEFNFVP